MISRLTAYAAVFAVLSAATITFAASAQQTAALSATPIAIAAPVVVQFPHVEIIGRRDAAALR